MEQKNVANNKLNEGQQLRLATIAAELAQMWVEIPYSEDDDDGGENAFHYVGFIQEEGLFLLKGGLTDGRIDLSWDEVVQHVMTQVRNYDLHGIEARAAAADDEDFAAAIDHADDDAPLQSKLRNLVSLSGLSPAQLTPEIEKFKVWYEGYDSGRLTEIYSPTCPF
jgi:hypothetical protein